MLYPRFSVAATVDQLLYARLEEVIPTSILIYRVTVWGNIWFMAVVGGSGDGRGIGDPLLIRVAWISLAKWTQCLITGIIEIPRAACHTLPI